MSIFGSGRLVQVRRQHYVTFLRRYIIGDDTVCKVQRVILIVPDGQPINCQKFNGVRHRQMLMVGLQCTEGIELFCVAAKMCLKVADDCGIQPEKILSSTELN